MHQEQVPCQFLRLMCDRGCTNFWNDADLRSAAGNNDKAFLDIYQVHYYDYMRDQDTYKSPNDVYSKDGRSAEYYLDTDPGKKRPLLLGEVPVSSQTNLRTRTGFNAFTSAL